MELFRSLVGSRLWGVSHDQSDYDYRSVVASPLGEVLLTGGNIKHVQTEEDGTDITIYEANHFVRLLRNGNMTMIETLMQPVWSQHLSPQWCRDMNEQLFKMVDRGQALSSAIGLVDAMLKKGRSESGERRGKTLYSGYIALKSLDWISGDTWAKPELTEHEKGLLRLARHGYSRDQLLVEEFLHKWLVNSKPVLDMHRRLAISDPSTDAIEQSDKSVSDARARNIVLNLYTPQYLNG